MSHCNSNSNSNNDCDSDNSDASDSTDEEGTAQSLVNTLQFIRQKRAREDATMEDEEAELVINEVQQRRCQSLKRSKVHHAIDNDNGRNDDAQNKVEGIFRNYAKSPPNFAALASQYQWFNPYVRFNHTKTYATIDWNDEYAIAALTRVLLWHDFRLHFDIPIYHLCPPVPQRWHYLVWIHKLLEDWAKPKTSFNSASRATTGVRALDIGTGASCIFPLLGSKMFGWKWIATEIDEESLESCKKNILSNNLESLIELRHNPNPCNIVQDILKAGDRVDVVVCNPPFFDSMDKTGQNKQRVCNATSNELTTDGGEERFLLNLIEQGKELHKRSQNQKVNATPCVGIYTSMIGRKETLKALKKHLHSIHFNQLSTQSSQDLAPFVQNIISAEFTNGRQTRWGIGWTFHNSLTINRDREDG